MRKVFHFAIDIDGIQQFLIQEAKEPTPEIGEVSHGAFNHDIKEAGGVTVSNAELKHIAFSETGDSWAFDWMQQAQDANTEQGGLDFEYKRDVVFRELDPHQRTINAWLWEGAWCKKVDKDGWKRGAKNENHLKNAIIVVDRVKKIF